MLNSECNLLLSSGYDGRVISWDVYTLYQVHIYGPFEVVIMSILQIPQDDQYVYCLDKYANFYKLDLDKKKVELQEYVDDNEDKKLNDYRSMVYSASSHTFVIGGKEGRARWLNADL